MSGPQINASPVTPEHPSLPQGFASWPAYWGSQGMPWRTEPEIPLDRQQYLAERRNVQPDIHQGIYPFRDNSGSIRLDRADVEWLLATHENGKGPIFWGEISHETAVLRGRSRSRLDLRGADLAGADLSSLPLAHLLGGLITRDWNVLESSPDLREAAALNCRGATLSQTHLEGAILRGAHFEGAKMAYTVLKVASLAEAHFEGANLENAKFQEATVIRSHFEAGQGLPAANLQSVYFDEMTLLDWPIFGGDHKFGSALLADIHWGGTNLGRIEWQKIQILGDEIAGSSNVTYLGKARTAVQKREARVRAVRVYRQLAIELRQQGITEAADRFSYRANCLQRKLYLREGHPLKYIGSAVLWMVAGYGYRPVRSFITYAAVILAFAALYVGIGSPSAPMLQWNEAVVISMSAFHGRGFVSTVFQPGDIQAIIAAIEAFIGLLIEIILIATFTQRFFAR